MSDGFSLELLNGNWSIAALALMVICALYLRHELLARRILPFGSRTRLTDGIKIAMATFATSTGIFIRSAETWRWRTFGGELDQGLLMGGGIVAVIGFLCLIREKSLPLFGRAPWLCTLAAMVLYSLISVIHEIHLF